MKDAQRGNKSLNPWHPHNPRSMFRAVLTSLVLASLAGPEGTHTGRRHCLPFTGEIVAEESSVLGHVHPLRPLLLASIKKLLHTARISLD